ncbi:hypothetical protein L7F22_033841 [Adiantum nelumboides]|nr:hypothetical protein [Adiantum nelumboides]
MHISAPIAAVLLLLLHPAAHAQRLSLPPLWNFSADASFPSSSSSRLNRYTVIAPFSLFSPILSSPAFASGSKGFSLGFLSLFQSPSSSPSHISLSICLGVQQQSSSSNGATPFLVPVWSLNTTNPLQQQQGALVKLQVDDNKQLLLADGDGSVVWSLSNVDSMLMHSNGNLVIYDSSNQSIWQSFEHPSDCLLQGQRLRMGMEITSSNNMYKAAMQAGGLAFYQVSTNPWPLVFWVYMGNKTLSNYFWPDLTGVFSLDKNAPVNLTAVLASPNCAKAEFNTSLAYFVLDGGQYVAQDACANINPFLVNTTVDLVRLDNDGTMRDYTVHQLLNSSYVFSSTKANFRPCFSPNVCGSYGICSASNTFGDTMLRNCRCPAEEDNASLREAFTLIDKSNPSEGCTRKVHLKCEQASSQSLVEIQKVAYMSMLPFFERTWEYSTKSLEDCKASCSLNCSCSGLLYHTGSSFCLPFGDTTPLSNVSFLSLGSDEHIAFVKIQPSEGKSLSQTIIVVVAVFPPVVVICIVLSAIYWKCRRKHIDSESKLAEEQLLSVLSMLPTRYSYRDLARFTQGFCKCLGSGGFGKVYEEMRVMGNEDWYFPEWAAKKTREGTVEDLVDKRLVVTLPRIPMRLIETILWSK